MLKKKRLVVAVSIAITSVAPGVSAEDSSEPMVLEEMIVTAERRDTSAQDLGMSLQSFSGEQLDKTNMVSFGDVLPSVSGMSFTNFGSGANLIALRGISNNTGNTRGALAGAETVALYLDDVAITGQGVTPNLNIYDLSTMEVLKGPQGSLYGDGAMGGAVLMNSNRPNYSELEITGDVMGSAIEDGGNGYQMRGMINAPIIEDKAALRVSATYIDMDGYIDNIATGEDDVNSRDVTSFRMLFGGLIGEKTDYTIQYFYDESNFDDLSDVNPGLDDLENNLEDNRYAENEFELISLTVNHEFDFATLSAIISHVEYERDVSTRFGLFGGTFLGSPQPEETDLQLYEEESDSFELRVVSAGDERFDWIVGAYYRDLDSDSCSNLTLPTLVASPFGFLLPTESASPCHPDGTPMLFSAVLGGTFEQTAVYGDMSFEIVPKLDLVFGARWFEEDFDNVSALYIPPAFGGEEEPTITGGDEESDVIYKAGFKYYATSDLTAYFTYSEGFRSGYFNAAANLSTVDPVPPTVKSDAVDHFELGFNSNLFSQQMMLNAALFYIEWSDIQTTLLTIDNNTGALVGYNDNSGEVEVFGVEFGISALLNERTTLGLNYSYLDTEYTDTANTGVVEGSSVPFSPENTLYSWIQYDMPLFGGEAYIRADVRFVDEQLSNAVQVGVPETPPLDDYWMSNLFIGWDASNWGVGFEVRNITNEIAEVGRTSFLESNVAAQQNDVVSQPRTYNIVLRFQY